MVLLNLAPTTSHPAVAMLFNLLCAIIGEGEESSFLVTIDDCQTVQDLQQRIKKEKDPDFALYDAHLHHAL
jgi:uncharacterized protein YfeS